MFCSTKPSWQGAYCVPPLHPPGRGSVRGSTPCQSQQNVSPFNHSRETSLSLHPSTWRAFLPPRPLTIPLRPLHGDQRREHSRYRSLEPSHRPMSLRDPWNPDQPCADWMPPSCRRWITLGGLSHPPKPSSSGLANSLSTDTEPCPTHHLTKRDAPSRPPISHEALNPPQSRG